MQTLNSMRCLSAPLLGFALALLSSSGSVRATFTITLDYSHDTAGSNFFSAGSAARAALEAAAADINAILGTSLGDITTADPHETFTAGHSVRFDPTFHYTNPDTGAAETITEANILATDEFRLFVGGRNLTSTTLAQGGRAGISYSAGATSNSGGIVAATDAAEAAFNAEYGRGGPIMDTLSGSFTFSPTTAPFDLTFGPTFGNLWFDTDTNNDTFEDSAAELDSWWHYDHTSTVAAGQYDIYTVALHEILHAIGFGTSDAFDGNISGTEDWTGAAVIAELGSGTNVLHTDSSHIDLSLSSTRISDGGSQSPVMLPSIGSGSRRELTNLDAAFLTDMGFSIVAVPEPGTFLALSPILLASAVGIRRRPRRRRV